jgi:hypothetical protein
MRGRETLGVLGIGALAIFCCAGLPGLLALLGGLTVVGLLGGGLLAALLVGCAALVAVRARRHRDCAAAPPEREA